MKKIIASILSVVFLVSFSAIAKERPERDNNIMKPTYQETVKSPDANRQKTYDPATKSWWNPVGPSQPYNKPDGYVGGPDKRGGMF